MPEITIPTASGSTSGYLATPPSGQGPPAIVLQEWWAVDGHIRSVSERLAAAGFFALAPELRPQRGSAHTNPPEHAALPVSIETATDELRGVADHLLAIPGVRGPAAAVIGFGFGGGLALWAVASWPQIAPTVVYYGLTPKGKPPFSRIKGPVLGHFGTADIFISLRDAKALETEIRSAGVDVYFEKYTGAGHGFFNENGRSGPYDASAAERSWERTVDFLRAQLAEPAREPAA
jgi:carboxymethylenebutenolidase